MKEFAVTPPSHFTYWLPGGLMFLAVVGMAYGASTGSFGPESTLVLLLLIPVFILVALFVTVVMRRRAVLLDGETLVVHATLHTRKVAVADLDLDAARVVNLADHPDLRPVWRMWGFGLPGYQAGLFFLRKHGRVFCLVTGRERVLVLPERGGRLMLLSLERPQALLDALRATGS